MSYFAFVVVSVGFFGATSLVGGVPSLGWPLVTAPVDPAVLTLFSAAVFGMSIKNVFDSILSDDEDGDSDGGGEQMSDGAGLMGDEGGGGGDELGGLGGLDEGGDDEFGDFGDDEFGDMDGGGGPDTDELEHRLDELENEVGSLSSTVNTVRNENEQISETVDDVEENVRKLLDIYEMVTRGVNPFADDIDGGLGGAGEGESFGLFDDGGEAQEEAELDEDIANADAEGFFDDDLVEEDTGGDEFGGSVEDVMGGGGSSEPSAEDTFEEEFNDDFGDMDDSTETGDFGDEMSMEDDFDDGGGSDDGGGGDGGKSFQELKDEYESGDAEWAEGEEPEDAGDEFDTAEADTEFETDSEFGDDLVTEEDDGDLLEEPDDDDLADDELFDSVIDDEAETAEPDPATETAESEATTEAVEPEPEPEPEPAVEPETADAATEPEPTTDAEPETATEETDDTATQPSSGEGKPYLGTMPEGFAMELIVVEWLEYLVGEVGVRSTAEAIDYYERIDWISEPVADDLQDYLRGFDAADGSTDDLTIDHHTQSLKYIGQLNGGAPQTATLGHLFSGGGSDGLQR